MLRRCMIREKLCRENLKNGQGQERGMSEEIEESHETPSMSSADGLICEIAVDSDGVSRDRLSICHSLFLFVVV